MNDAVIYEKLPSGRWCCSKTGDEVWLADLAHIVSDWNFDHRGLSTMYFDTEGNVRLRTLRDERH